MSTPQRKADSFIAEYGNVNPTPSRFKICFSHGCQKSTILQINKNEWARVQKIFHPMPTNASGERKNIAKAIGMIETIVGKLSDTAGDQGGTFSGIFSYRQMDCEDEAVNTATYMTMMRRDGMIIFHELLRPAYRGFFLNGWPHMATVIAEKDKGEKFVVDSWFLNNGEPPFILPYKKWKNGWRPGNSSTAGEKSL